MVFIGGAQKRALDDSDSFIYSDYTEETVRFLSLISIAISIEMQNCREHACL